VPLEFWVALKGTEHILIVIDHCDLHRYLYLKWNPALAGKLFAIKSRCNLKQSSTEAAKFDRLQLIGYRMQRSTGFFVRLPPFKSFKRFKTFETEWSD
jgi:hypothetical protein